jgi:Right handed beta helix region
MKTRLFPALMPVIVLAAFAVPAALDAAGSTGGSAASPATRRPDAKCTRFAARWGSDGNRGTKARPFKTAQRLADSLRPGQTGCLRRGIYDETNDGFVLRVERGGANGRPLTIRSFPGERARLRGIVWILEGADDVTVSHLDIEGPESEITFKVYASDVVLDRNTFTNGRRGKSCLKLGSTSGSGVVVHPVVRRNRFHDCGNPADGNLGHAIYVENVAGGQITRNVFWNMQAYAIQFYPSAQRTRFANNVVDGGPPSVRGGVLFGGDGEFASSGNIVERNVIAYARTYNVTSTWDGKIGTENVARNNCLWGGGEGNIDNSNGGFVASANVVAPPRFVDRRRHDYRLKAGSRCRQVVGR